MSGEKLLTGVIGSPIEHSRSPLIHNYWLRKHGLRGVYGPYHVTPERFEAFLELAPALGFRGFNVTVPLKTLAFDCVAERTTRAERAQSVNTVVFDEDGRPRGDSTDGYGFLASLEQSLGATPWRGQTTVMIGAGGAARAVAAALVDDGVARIRIANRTRANAEVIASAFPEHVELVDWPFGATLFEGAALIINGTSLGLAGGGEYDWRLPALAPGAVATDMVYAPLETPFLKAAALAGARTVDGLGMLLHQARPSFEAWHGVDPAVTPELRRIALEGKGCLP